MRDVALTQPKLGRAVTRGKLRRLAGIHRRDSETVLAVKLLLAEARHFLVRLHSSAHRVVIGGNVLKPLLEHAFRDQRLNLVDRLNELFLCEAEFLCAESWRRLPGGGAGRQRRHSRPQHERSHRLAEHTSHRLALHYPAPCLTSVRPATDPCRSLSRNRGPPAHRFQRHPCRRRSRSPTHSCRVSSRCPCRSPCQAQPRAPP